MKAYIYRNYGPPEVLKLTEVTKPIPKHDEVLIKIHATAVTASDIFIRSSRIPLHKMILMRLMTGIIRPRKQILGLVLAGVVESSGQSVKRFRPGDLVYGLTGFGFGTYAEYKCMKEKDSNYGCLALMPSAISFEEATAAAYGGLLAFQFMDKADLKKGKNVLIYGASGTTGTMATQLACFHGAKVTAVCSTDNIDLVKSLGAEDVIDYTVKHRLNPEVKYDFILDAVGKSKSSKLKSSLRKHLAIGGVFKSIDDESLQLNSERLAIIKDFIEAGYIRPVLDRSYSFDELPEAHRYVEKGHKKGGVAVTVVPYL